MWNHLWGGMASKKPFTLLEILICMALLLMLGGVTAIQGKKLIDNHRVESELVTLKAELYHTRSFVSSIHSDVSVTLENSEEGLVMKRFSHEPLNHKLDPLFSGKPHIYSHLKLEDDEPLALLFTANGTLVSEGVALTLEEILHSDRFLSR